MLVSIIIPMFNVAPYIERCLRSVAAQTYRHIEVVLIDDCSTDNTMQKAQSIVTELNRDGIKYVFIQHERNSGAATTRNSGIRQATGDYIYFLDGDDEITPNCIELLVAPMLLANYDFTIGDYEEDGGISGCQHLGFEGSCEGVLEAYSKGWVNAMPVNKLINLSFLRNNELYFRDGLLFEDEIWSFQLVCKARCIYGIKAPTYLYHIRKDSTMGVSTQQHYLDWRLRIAPIMRDYMDQHGLSYNVYANNVIESFSFPLFVLPSLTQSYQYYKQLRKTFSRNRQIYWNLSITSMRGFMKYSHYLLPVPIGYGQKLLLRLRRSIVG